MNLNNTFIHPTALISPDAEIGESVRIGAYTIVNSGVSIGDDSEVSDFCTLGEGPLRDKASLCIGSGSFVRSHAVVYAGSSFGEKLETGHHVVIRENTHAGENLRVGNFSDIEGDCKIGDFCRLHGYAHVGKGRKIGNFVWLFQEFYIMLN